MSTQTSAELQLEPDHYLHSERPFHAARFRILRHPDSESGRSLRPASLGRRGVSASSPPTL